MKLFSVSRILFCLLSLFVLSAASSAEVLKIVVNDAIHPITDEYMAAPSPKLHATRIRLC